MRHVAHAQHLLNPTTIKSMHQHETSLHTSKGSQRRSLLARIIRGMSMANHLQPIRANSARLLL